MTTETKEDFSAADLATAWAQGFRDGLAAAMNAVDAARKTLDIRDDEEVEERLSRENITEPEPAVTAD